MSHPPIPPAYPPGWQPEGGAHHGYQGYPPHHGGHWPAPPRATPPPDPGKRMMPLGLVGLATAVVLGSLIFYRVLASLLTAALDEAQRKLLPGAVPPPLAKVADQMTRSMRTIAEVELGCLAPVALSAIVLGIMAIALLAKKRWAVKGMMGWGGLGLFSAALAAALQIIFLAPELRALERALAKLTAAGTTPTITAPTLVRTMIPVVFLALCAITALAWAWYVDQKLDEAI